MSIEIHYTANLDFKKDYAAICIEELNADGFTVTATDPFDIVVQYTNYKSRLPEPNKRNVFKSSTFSFSSDQADPLKVIEQKIEKGETLRSHLSTRITDLNYNDPMLNDWGIYHLHLGTAIEPNGFVSRTGALLFAFIDKKNVYFLAIGDHNSWTDLALMEILHRDFPEAIEKFKADIVMADGILASGDIKKLRPRVNYMLTLSDGTIYHSIGGGVTTSGVGIKVATGASYHLKMVLYYEDAVKNNLDIIGDFVKDRIPENDYVLDIEFVGWEGDLNKPVIHERKSGAKISIANMI
ncbi:hypothetical protein [Spirosoma pulveris]